MAKRTTLLLLLTLLAGCEGPSLSLEKPRAGLVWETSAFLHAVQGGNHSLAEEYLETGMSPDSSNELGITGLMLACQKGDQTMVRLLLRYGAALNLEDHRGLTALDYASMKPQSKVFPLLVAHGAQYGHLRNR